MSLDAVTNARAIRDRLHNPPNAVADTGITLKNGRPVRPEKPRPFYRSQVINIDPQPTFTVPPYTGADDPTEITSASCLALVECGERPVAEEFKPPRMVEIQYAVARAFAIAHRDMVSARRTAQIVGPRQVAMALCKRLTPGSLPEIGRRFGGRDHTTALHACRKFQWLIDELETKRRSNWTLDEWANAAKLIFDSNPLRCAYSKPDKRRNDGQDHPVPA